MPLSKKIVTPEDLRPLPKADFSKPKSAGRQRDKTSILTDTPEKMLIEDRTNKKNTKGIKRNVMGTKINKNKDKKKQKVVNKNTSSSSEEEETACLVCLVSYKKIARTGYSVRSVSNGLILDVRKMTHY